MTPIVLQANVAAKKPRISDLRKPIGVTLKKEYIEQIRDGLLQQDGTKIFKTVEGRIYSRIFPNVMRGNLLDFFYMSNRKDNVVCRVVEKTIYSSFAEMLSKEGVSNCLPKLRNDQLPQAIKAYEAIPGYAEKAKKFGVVALKLEVVTA